jgi:NAD(P)-dependent dehydrogenase (short-subunit alcohol dehydrogenase family)
MGTFDGKVAFITGIARAQGRSHALRLASGGADIIGVDIVADISGLHYHLASQHDLHETIELIERTGQRAIIRTPANSATRCPSALQVLGPDTSWPRASRMIAVTR